MLTLSYDHKRLTRLVVPCEHVIRAPPSVTTFTGPLVVFGVHEVEVQVKWPDRTLDDAEQFTLPAFEVLGDGNMSAGANIDIRLTRHAVDIGAPQVDRAHVL